MRVLVDADACPVLELVRRLCAEAVVKVITVSSFRHDIRGPDHVMVGPEPQAADMALINRTQRGDIVVAQDWGLAALAAPGPNRGPAPGRRGRGTPGGAGAACACPARAGARRPTTPPLPRRSGRCLPADRSTTAPNARTGWRPLGLFSRGPALLFYQT